LKPLSPIAGEERAHRGSDRKVRVSNQQRPSPAFRLRPQASSPAVRERGLWAGSVRDPAQGADFGEFARQFRPALAGILGLVQFAVMTARDDEPGIGWMRR